MKLWSSVMTGGLPKCKRGAPKSQSLSKPFHPMLYPDFWDFFFSVSLPTGGSDEEIWQPCTAISDEDLMHRGFSFLQGPWQPLLPQEHQELWRWAHTSPSTSPDPSWLPDLPATALLQSISEAVRGAGCQQGKGWRDIWETELTAKPSLVEMLSASCLRGTEIFAFC